MSTKVISLGNYLMKDDKIGLLIGENLKMDLNTLDIELIQGETDFLYCISRLCENDLIFILDAMISDKNLGNLSVIKLDDYYKISPYTQHSLNLIQLLPLYFNNINGYILGIEVCDISYNLDLSYKIKENLNSISKNVLKEIKSLLFY
ncbi:MAG: hydrogenase maturation protease [Clostridiaceae bacterium]